MFQCSAKFTKLIWATTQQQNYKTKSNNNACTMYVCLNWSKQAINSCNSDSRVIGISLILLRYDDKNLIPLSMQIRYFFGKKFFVPHECEWWAFRYISSIRNWNRFGLNWFHSDVLVLFLFVACNANSASISDKNLECTIHIIKKRLFLLFRAGSGECVWTNSTIPIASELNPMTDTKCELLQLNRM